MVSLPARDVLCLDAQMLTWNVVVSGRSEFDALRKYGTVEYDLHCDDQYMPRGNVKVVAIESVYTRVLS